MGKEYVTTLTRKGQITVPVEVRRALGLKEGDRVAISLTNDGEEAARLRPAPSIARLTAGALKQRKPMATPIDLRDARRIYTEERASKIVRDMTDGD